MEISQCAYLEPQDVLYRNSIGMTWYISSLISSFDRESEEEC